MEGETQDTQKLARDSETIKISKTCGTDYYKGIAEAYDKQKIETAARQSVELPNFLKLLGTLDQENVIDLACGGGFHTKVIRQKTKGLVYGADISSDMIDVAKKHAEVNHDDIKYFVHDCSKPLEISHKFDIVASTFLLQYAENELMLQAFLKNIFDLLQPGGRLIGLNLNPYWTAEEVATFQNELMSIWRECTGPLRDFEKLVVFDKVRDFTLPAFFILPSTFEKQFSSAGFEKLRWVPMEIEKEVSERKELEVFTKGPNYPQIAFEACKPLESKSQVA